jgi:hypothetical protein
MRKIISISVISIVLLFASCKKDRECECSITMRYPAGTVNADGTNFLASTKVVVYEDATKREAKKLCKSVTIKTSDGYTTEKECEVKF